MLHYIADWEHNGYHDSDFYALVWDDDAETLRSVETGSTRYGGGYDYRGITKYDHLPHNIETAARAYLEEQIYQHLKNNDERKRNEPQQVEVGDHVILLEPHKNMAKETVSTPCHKCDGTGKWVNPRNPDDVRTCYGCNGKKYRRLYGDRVKDKDGKQVWRKFPVGTRGTVAWVGTFNTIYSNGYNKLGRGTLSTILDLDDGEQASVPLHKLALDIPPTPEAELRAKAHRLAYNGSLLSRYLALYGNR